MALPRHNKLFITAPQASREIGLCLSTWRKLIKKGEKNGGIRSFTIPSLRGRFMHRYDVVALFRSMSQGIKPGMSDMKTAGVSIPASK